MGTVRGVVLFALPIVAWKFDLHKLTGFSRATVYSRARAKVMWPVSVVFVDTHISIYHKNRSIVLTCV